MTSIYSCRLKSSIRFSVLIVFLFTSLSFSQTDRDTRDRSTSRFQDNSRFIVAFELSPEKGFHFTWPYESMRPAPYEMVLIKVKKMPRILDGEGRLSRQLPASRFLKINGEFPRPLRLKTSEPGTQFEVRLRKGRLRFSLLLSETVTIDPQNKVARIEVYEINKRRNP